LADLIPSYLGKEALELLDDLTEVIGTSNTDEGSKQVIELITGLTREEPLNKILSSKKE
jgi:predicted mannosyl-3-phosphoglycerate phosphatase (HAD superfamily)